MRKKAPPNRVALTDGFIKTVRLRLHAFAVWDTVQQGLVLRVRPTGTKTFKVCYRHQGRVRWYTLDRYGAIGLKEARENARNIRARATLGQDPQGEKVEARIGDTLKDIHDQYLRTVARDKNKSWEQGKKLMERHILPTLGNRKVKDLGRRDLWRLFDSFGERRSMANAVLAAASATFAWAVKRDLISQNPCQGIERHKTRSSARFLSNDEIRTVWPLFGDLGLYQSTILQLILLTAQRPGEVRAMRWEHLDLEAGLWSMPGAPTTGWPGTKNSRDHEVPLSEPALTLLHDLDPQPTGHVFPSIKRGKCVSIPSTLDIWATAAIPRFRPHDLRATAATGMDALGVSRQHISLVLNHVEGGVTAGYVRHDQREHKRAALEAWVTELQAILERKGKTDRKAEVVELEERRTRRV